MGIWQFVQDELLGMKWLNRVIETGLSAIGLDINGRLGGSVQFFLYDVIKITILLCFLILLFLIFKVTFLLSAARRFWAISMESVQISSLPCWGQ